MISRKDNEDRQLIKYGTVIPFSPNGNNRRELEISLSKILGLMVNMGGQKP